MVTQKAQTDLDCETKFRRTILGCHQVEKYILVVALNFFPPKYVLLFEHGPSNLAITAEVRNGSISLRFRLSHICLLRKAVQRRRHVLFVPSPLWSPLSSPFQSRCNGFPHSTHTITITLRESQVQITSATAALDRREIDFALGGGGGVAS